jgi:hypothetical protein
VVRVWSNAIAIRTATAAQNNATTTIFATGRAWIWSARIGVTLKRASGQINRHHASAGLR